MPSFMISVLQELKQFLTGGTCPTTNAERTLLIKCFFVLDLWIFSVCFNEISQALICFYRLYPQIHGSFEVKRYLQRSFSPTPPAQIKVSQNRLLRTVSGWVSSMCRGRDSKQCSPMFRCNFICFNFCPFPPVLLAGTAEKSLGPSALLPPIGYLYTLVRSL